MLRFWSHLSGAVVRRLSRSAAPLALAATLSASLVAAATPARADIGAYIVVDVNTGMVLDQRNAFQTWYPASVSKLMTAYVTFRLIQSGRITLNSPVTVSQNALSQAPSKMGFKVGTVLTVDNALKMMIVKSANDIAVAIAESTAGSEPAFVAMMNSEAHRLGMTRSHFDNPNGLPDDGQLSNARDLAVLATAILRDYPQYKALFGITGLKFGKQIIRTHNRLLERYVGADGMKTGFICNSGFNVVATATRNGRTLLTVVLGAYNTRERDEFAARALEMAFEQPGRRGPTLAALRNPPGMGTPANRKAFVCGPNRAKAGTVVASADQGDDDAPGELGYIANGDRLIPTRTDDGKSYLSATRITKPPVPVFIGGASGTAVASATPFDGTDATPGGLPKKHPAKTITDLTANAAMTDASYSGSTAGLPGVAGAPTDAIASAAKPGVSVPLSLLPPALLNPGAAQ